MIEIKMESYEEDKIVEKIVDKATQQIFKQGKYWGDVPQEGHYSTFDRFKNQIAQMVADKIFKHIIESGEVEKRVKIACDKAEIKIQSIYFEKLNTAVRK